MVIENKIEQCCAAHIIQCCQQYCSALLHPIAGLIQTKQLVQYCWQHWIMWAAQHYSILFSIAQNRLCNFCCVHGKKSRVVEGYSKKDWTMLCCPHCSMLSTILFSIVELELAHGTILLYCCKRTILSTTLNNASSKTLFKAVLNSPEQVVQFCRVCKKERICFDQNFARGRKTARNFLVFATYVIWIIQTKKVWLKTPCDSILRHISNNSINVDKVTSCSDGAIYISSFCCTGSVLFHVLPFISLTGLHFPYSAYLWQKFKSNSVFLCALWNAKFKGLNGCLYYEWWLTSHSPMVGECYNAT